MSILDPVDRAGWLGAMLALEEDGEPVTAVSVAQRLKQTLSHTRRTIGRMRDRGYVSGVNGAARVSARGRWYLGRPVLVVVATVLDGTEPWATAARATALAIDVAAGIGAPAVPLVPAQPTLASAATGNAEALEALVAFARRADVLVVADADPLLEMRPDVVAAQRADVLVVVAPIGAAGVVKEALCSGGRHP